MGFYEKFTDRAGQHRFRLKAGNGEIILASEGYTTSSARDNGISSVQVNSQINDRYEDKNSRANEPYFVLKAGNGQIIGISEMYSSVQARDKGKASVKVNGVSTDIRG
ncbi:UNVERIFIED_CONTAM: hypothetical protein GTU68_014827 [Idotea baltica]|nr:hypothetical protein [Idotea baltica]